MRRRDDKLVVAVRELSGSIQTPGTLRDESTGATYEVEGANFASGTNGTLQLYVSSSAPAPAEGAILVDARGADDDPNP